MEEGFIPLEFTRMPEDEMTKAARAFYQRMNARRTVRDFKADKPPREIIEKCVHAAGTAPSGAHKQPWSFVVVESPDVKRKIREAAEEEERAFYGGRASDEWLAAVEPFGTDANKPFLETAPYLIAIFAHRHEMTEEGEQARNYYVTESVGIATGMLIAGLHHAGLATLTHTPSPMKFMADVLDRPKNERAFLLLVVGYPTDDAKVPALDRKPLEELATFV